MARRLKKRTTRYEADLGPDGPLDRGERVLDLTAAFKRSKRVIECRVDWYLGRGYITEREHRAGMLFRENWLTAVRSPKLIASYEVRIQGDQQDGAARQEAARRWVVAELTPLPRMRRDIVVAVCGLDDWASKSVTTVEHGKKVRVVFELGKALTVIADHNRL